MDTKALYAGSFDPVTLGHIDIIKRSSRMFGHVVVAVGVNPQKPGLFTPNERIDLIKLACKGLEGTIDTVFVPCHQKFASISSSLVKEIAGCLAQGKSKAPEKMAAKLDGLVTPAVIKKLLLKFS